MQYNYELLSLKEQYNIVVASKSSLLFRNNANLLLVVSLSLSLTFRHSLFGDLVYIEQTHKVSLFIEIRICQTHWRGTCSRNHNGFIWSSSLLLFLSSYATYILVSVQLWNKTILYSPFSLLHHRRLPSSACPSFTYTRSSAIIYELQ